MSKTHENNSGVDKRRDDALRRALNTPPKPKAKPKDEKSQDKKDKPSD